MRAHNAGRRTSRAGRRLLLASLTAGTLIVGAAFTASSSEADLSLSGVPRASCGTGDLPETAEQGRVPNGDYTSGRAKQGYRCNTVQVGHYGSRTVLGSGGYTVQRYTDVTGRTCAYYDSALMVGLNLQSLLTPGGGGLGVVVLDMTDPAHPVRTANLITPAMLQPHESLLVNQERGLLAAVMGTLATAPGILDVYDVSQDCRKPKLRSSTLSGVMGHESGFAPDGKTFWTAGAAGFTLTAVDLADPSRPKVLKTKTGVVYHGLRLSDDGRTMYVANIGSPGGTKGILTRAGLDVLDVSDVQDRRANPEIRTLSRLNWEESSIPQVAEPFTSNGRDYVLEVDEFSDLFGDFTKFDMPSSPVGAARIIDVTDPTAPEVVSNIRLEVHDPEIRGALTKDRNALTIIHSYTGHYCSVPTRDNPKIAGCSMIASGLRLFDISDVTHPREVGYFNEPGADAAAALSQPAWDVANKQVWYTDQDEGFFAVGLTGQAAALLP